MPMIDLRVPELKVAPTFSQLMLRCVDGALTRELP